MHAQDTMWAVQFRSYGSPEVLEVGPATAIPWLSSALRRYRRAKSLSFQALQIRVTS